MNLPKRTKSFRDRLLLGLGGWSLFFMAVGLTALQRREDIHAAWAPFIQTPSWRTWFMFGGVLVGLTVLIDLLRDWALRTLKALPQESNVLCAFGLHRWTGCLCCRCGEQREEEHDWDGCECRQCGKTQGHGHEWFGCKCQRCGAIRDECHQWEGCTCSSCGKTRHTWVTLDAMIPKRNSPHVALGSEAWRRHLELLAAETLEVRSVQECRRCGEKRETIDYGDAAQRTLDEGRRMRELKQLEENYRRMLRKDREMLPPPF